MRSFSFFHLLILSCFHMSTLLTLCPPLVWSYCCSTSLSFPHFYLQHTLCLACILYPSFLPHHASTSLPVFVFSHLFLCLFSSCIQLSHIPIHEFTTAGFRWSKVTNITDITFCFLLYISSTICVFTVLLFHSLCSIFFCSGLQHLKLTLAGFYVLLKHLFSYSC